MERARRARRTRTGAVVALVVAVAVAGLAGCGGDDDDADRSAATTRRPGTTTASSAGDASLRLSSPAFSDGAQLPEAFTCEGRNEPPPLDWTGVPAGSAELVLLLEDPDATSGTFVHWLVYRIPPAPGHVEAGSLSVQALEGANGFGRIGYGGPCPPRGDDPHRYVFTLTAVDQRLDLPGGASADDVREAMADHVVARATLTGTFARR